MRIDQSKQNISPSAIFSWPMTTSLNDVWDRSYFGDNLGESVYTVTPRDDDAPPALCGNWSSVPPAMWP